MKEYPVGMPVQFRAVATTQGSEESDHAYSWSFSDGSTASGSAPLVPFSAGGSITAIVSATIPGSGMVATDTTTVPIVDMAWEDEGVPDIRFSRPVIAQLNSGTVLLCGGPDATHNPGGLRCYEFDGTDYTRVGDLSCGRRNGGYGYKFQVLNDGRVLAAGNFTNATGSKWANRTTEIYDPITKTWSRLAKDPFDVPFDASTAKLLDGRVALFNNNRVALFDPNTDTWSLSSATSGWPNVGAIIRSLVMNNGKVFLCCYNSMSAVIYDPVLDTFSDLINLSGRPWGDAVLVQHGDDVWMFGMDTAYSPTKVAVYRGSTGTVDYIATTLNDCKAGTTSIYGEYIFLDCITLTAPSPLGAYFPYCSAFFRVTDGTFHYPRYMNMPTGLYQYGRFTINGHPYVFGSENDSTAPFTDSRRLNMSVL